MTKPIYEDPVVAEIHAIRQLLLAQCDSDINEYRKRVRQRQESSGRHVITEPFRNRAEQIAEPDRELPR
jgi:hypothetical protein